MTEPPAALEQLVRERYTAFKGHVHQTVLAACDLGEALYQLRRVYSHGKWGEYLEGVLQDEFAPSRRTLSRLTALGRLLEAQPSLRPAIPRLDLNLKWLYRLAEAQRTVSAPVVDGLASQQIRTRAEAERALAIEELKARAPEIATHVQEDRITLPQAQAMERAARHLSPPVAQAVVAHAVTNTLLYKPMETLAQTDPEQFAEIAASGVIYHGAQENGIPISHASPTDLRIKSREDRVESFLSWLSTQERFVRDELAKRQASHFTTWHGFPQGIARNIPALPPDQQFLVVVFKMNERPLSAN